VALDAMATPIFSLLFMAAIFPQTIEGDEQASIGEFQSLHGQSVIDKTDGTPSGSVEMASDV
jgi:hypothetical protein